MFLGHLFEGSTKQVKVIYPGRFQPFHKGHAQVYQHLCEKYGKDNVYIVTSDKVEMPKSPFSFAEKKRMMELTGIPTDKVVMDSQPYRAPGLVAQFDAASTILLFAISEKDMAEDPRFQFKPKKDGSPSYFQQFTDLSQCQTLDKHAYMMTVPTFDFTVLGKPANSASQIRAQFAGADDATQRRIVTDLFGKFDNNVFNIMKARLEPDEVAEGFFDSPRRKAFDLQKQANKAEILGKDSKQAAELRTNANAEANKAKQSDYSMSDYVEEDEAEDDNIVNSIKQTTGRTHEEAQRILRAARRRAMQMSKTSGNSMSEPAWGNTIAHHISTHPRGQEPFMQGESVEKVDEMDAQLYTTPKTKGVAAARTGKAQKNPYADGTDSFSQWQKAYDQERLQKFDPNERVSFHAGSFAEDRATPTKPPKKGSQRWLTAQKRKEYEKAHPPVEPTDQMYGTAKILPKQTDEGRVDQLPPGDADYSKYSTEALKWMLKPGMMHRDELKFKTLIRRELKKRETGQQVTELSPATHASHVEKRSPQVIPTLMKDVKKGAKMGRAVSKSMEKAKAHNQKSDEPSVFEETNSAEMARLQRELKKATDPNKKEAIKLNIRKLKGEMELRAKDKVTEMTTTQKYRFEFIGRDNLHYSKVVPANSPDDAELALHNFFKKQGIQPVKVGQPKLVESTEFNAPDVVKLDIPLMIRMLEFAREDAKTDLDLHNATEQLIKLSVDGKTLGMDEYNTIVSKEVQESIANFKRSLTESAQEDILNPDPKISALATAVVKMKKELHALTSGGQDNIEEGWGRKTAAGLAAAAAIGGAGIGLNKLDQNMQASEAEFVQQIKDPADLERYNKSKYQRNIALSQRSMGTVYSSVSDMENIRHARLVDKLKEKYNINETITKVKGGYEVKSHKGKNLGGPYPSKKQAAKRLGQVEYFKHKGKTESIVPGFGEMRPEQVQKEVEGLTAEMLQYARDGNMRAVAEYIKKLQPFVDTARKGEITESISKALRTAKRNAV